MKGLEKRILVMAAVTAICVWAAGKSGYAVKPIRLDETELAQQVQTLKENNLTKFSGVTIYDGIVIGDTAYYVMKQDFPEQEGMLGEMTAKRSWLGTWKFDSMGYGDSGINYDVIGCGGHNFLLLSGKDPEQQVAKVTLNWYGQTYEMTNESAKPYFLLCTELTGYMPDELLPSEDMFRFTIKRQGDSALVRFIQRLDEWFKYCGRTRQHLQGGIDKEHLRSAGAFFDTEIEWFAGEHCSPLR